MSRITYFFLVSFLITMDLYASQMSTSSSLNTNSSMSSLSAATVAAVQEKIAKDEQQEMKELEALYAQAVSKQEQEDELKEEAERAAPILVAEVKRLIANIDAVNPESEDEQKEIVEKVQNEIKKFHPNTQKELNELIQPSLERMHQRLVSYTPLRTQWEALLKLAQVNEQDEGLRAAVEQLRKKTEAIGYRDAAQARAQEILHPTWHSIEEVLAVTTHALADWMRDLWQFTPFITRV